MEHMEDERQRQRALALMIVTWPAKHKDLSIGWIGIDANALN
jgi:hypothetical protein